MSGLSVTYFPSLSTTQRSDQSDLLIENPERSMGSRLEPLFPSKRRWQRFASTILHDDRAGLPGVLLVGVAPSCVGGALEASYSVRTIST